MVLVYIGIGNGYHYIMSFCSLPMLIDVWFCEKLSIYFTKQKAKGRKKEGSDQGNSVTVVALWTCALLPGYIFKKSHNILATEEDTHVIDIIYVDYCIIISILMLQTDFDSHIHHDGRWRRKQTNNKQSKFPILSVCILPVLTFAIWQIRYIWMLWKQSIGKGGNTK